MFGMHMLVTAHTKDGNLNLQANVAQRDNVSYDTQTGSCSVEFVVPAEKSEDVKSFCGTENRDGDHANDLGKKT